MTFDNINISNVTEDINLNEGNTNNNDKESINNKDITETKNDSQEQSSYTEEEQINLNTKKNDRKETTIYFIISCSKAFSFSDYTTIYLESINGDQLEIYSTEIIKVEHENKNNEGNKSYKNDVLNINEYSNLLEKNNVYLYKINIHLEREEEKFGIKINYDEKYLLTEPTFTIRRNQSLFIYNMDFIVKNKNGQTVRNPKPLRNLFGKHFNAIYSLFKDKLSLVQKFSFYIKYLERSNTKHLIPNLVEITNNVIKNLKTETVDFELIVLLVISLIQNENDFSKLSNEMKLLLEKVMQNLKEKEIINGRKYNKVEYDRVIGNIENYELNYSENSFTTWFYLFLLMYYQFNPTEEDKFYTLFRKIPEKEEAIEFIKNHKTIFINLKARDFQHVFEVANKNNTSFNDIISLISNFNDYIQFFYSNEKFILQQQPKINFDKIPEPDVNIEIKYLIPYIDILNKMRINYLNNDDEQCIIKQFTCLIKKLKNKYVYQKLVELREICHNNQNFEILKSIEQELNLAIHTVGKNRIEKGQLSNMEIIQFIQEDSRINNEDYENKPAFASLIGYVDLDSVDGKCCSVFNSKNTNYKDIFEKNYNQFLDSLMKKAKTFKHLFYLLKLFNIETNSRPGEPVVKKLIEVYCKNDLEKNGMNQGELFSIVDQLFILSSHNNNISMNSLIKLTSEKYFSKEESNTIFIKLLNDFGDNLSPKVVGNLIENINDLSNNNIFNILDRLRSKDVKVKFIKSLKSKAAKDEDIFNIKFSDSLNLLREFIQRGYFKYDDKNYKKIMYIKKTNDMITNQIKNLKEGQFYMDQVKSMCFLLNQKNPKFENNLKERFYILSLGDLKRNDIDGLYQKIVQQIKKCEETVNKIDEIISIFREYYPKEKSYIVDKYKKIKEEINGKPICDFPKKDKLDEFDKHYREVHHISKLKESKFFYNIYKNNKNKNSKEIYDDTLGIPTSVNKNSDKNIMDETEELFKCLQNLFDEETENNVDVTFLEKIISEISDIQSELIKLRDIFGLSENSKNSIEEKLKLLKSKKENINIYEKLIALFNDFDIKSKDIRNVLDKIISRLNGHPSLNELIIINNEVRALNIDILKNNIYDNQTLDSNSNKKKSNKKANKKSNKKENDSDKLMNNSLENKKRNNQIMESILNLIVKMYEKPEFMTFIRTKTINDVRQMAEFIGDSENDYIKLEDIDQLVCCVDFIQDLRYQSNGLTELEFLDLFVDLYINDQKYKNIYNELTNSLDKFSDFNDLYNSHLNPNELNKVHIKRIFKLSTFTLKFQDPEYQCFVEYYNDKKKVVKEFEEMLDLRAVALLKKKDNNDNDCFNICNSFAKIINDIQKIISILNTIASNGYFEEIEYKININNGYTSICKMNLNSYSVGDDKEKTMEEVIEELKNINELQRKEVKYTYSNNPLIRLIHGRQFNLIYQYMNSNDSIISPKLKNILKYVTNHFLSDLETVSKNLNIEVQPNVNEPLKQMFVDVNEYLDKLFISNNLKLNNIYKKAIILNLMKKGIYSHTCPKKDIEKNAIRCSLKLTGKFPLAQTVLYCNENTTEEEIISFIYRSVKCDQNALFILIKPETLAIEKKNLLIEYLKELYGQDPKKMISCLLFIYSNENKKKEVIIEIEKLPFHKYYDFKDTENDSKNDKIDNISKENKKERQIENKNRNNGTKTDQALQKISDIKVYSSEFSGLGKSTLIKQDFEKEFPNHHYVYFPVGGNIDKKEIIERLIELTDQKIALHLDFYDTCQFEFIQEFLFSFLVLKFFIHNENVYYYGEEMKIKVEIPNGFVNYQQLFPIFEFFEISSITANDIPPLIVSENLDSDIQIVCAYINEMEKINNENIHIDKPLNQATCENLIHTSLGINNRDNTKYYNYYQIGSYIKILAEQLKLLSNSVFLSVEAIHFQYQSNETPKIRQFFVESLMQVTKHFITSSYDNIIKGQHNTFNQQKQIISTEEANERAIKLLSEKKPFSIKNVRPSILLINEDQHSVTPIITCKKNQQEYRLLNSFYEIGLTPKDKKDQTKMEIPNYNKFTSRQFLEEVRKVLDINYPIDEEDKDYIPTDLNNVTYLKDIVKSYVFTADNFIKLILISLRLRTNIPVILMGETGCGKTSLIRIITNLKKITIHILNIHAGIEDEDIFRFISDKNLFEEEILNSGDTNNNDINEKKNNKSNNDIWVFLDEINTCNSLGLITEIMLKNSCKGHRIKKGVKFIAACNPYRLDTSKQEIVGLYDEKKYLVRKLVYSVNPLPHSLLNFVFDFSSPGKEDNEKYISNMISDILQKNISKNGIYNRIKGIAEKAVFEAHEFIKTNYDISSVSLREIRRWGILFEWFNNKLLNNPYIQEKLNFLKNEKTRFTLAVNLSIYLCYYIRMYDKEKRKEFLRIMKHSFGDQFEFENFPEKIQNIIADAVELEKGIAKNRALLENLFAIFVCLNTKIPLFIIGKPGCSKSLSAQLIFKSMNGKNSSNPFFKHFPKVYHLSYQGSLTSNSKGILKIFKKARDALNNESLSKEIISAIYFDEMGLAEISSNNPLKVIHSQLEYDDNEQKVAFIGISNWTFDASKMNRGIHLSIPTPDKDDLIKTAISIAESYDLKLKQNYNEEFTCLSYTYFDYKEILRDNPSNFENSNDKHHLEFKSPQNNIKEFHGTRDFYHLIKIVCKLFIAKNFPKEPNEIEAIINEGIERNFGGLDNSIIKFKEILKKYIPNIHDPREYNVMECIANNIKDPESRFLLIETKSSISQFLVTLILNKLDKNYIFYYGSNFEEDVSQNYYSAKTLNKIQVTINEENVMILKNLTSVYPSLYDLFNQNFCKKDNCNYTKIALGNSNTHIHKVNDNFRCIVLLDKNEISKQDPPFINRFEKHIITFEDLLKNQKDRDFCNGIFNIFEHLVEDRDKKLKIDLRSVMLNCDLEEIQGMVYQYLINYNNFDDDSDDNNIDTEEEENEEDNEEDSEEDDEIINNDNNNQQGGLIIHQNDAIDYNKLKRKLYEKIIQTLSQDVIFYSKYSEFSKKYKEEYQFILTIYLKYQDQHKNLKDYLEKITTNKHIIYTYSNILDSIYDNQNEINIPNRIYGPFTKMNTKNVFINQGYCERTIEEIIFDYYSNEEFKLCVFHFNVENIIHLNHINFLIENYETNLKENEDLSLELKPIIFILHLKRIIITDDADFNSYQIHNEYLISHLTKWKQLFIDNLNGQNISIEKVINSTNDELFENKKLFNMENEFQNILYHAFGFIKYNYKINITDNIKDEDYIVEACEYINSDEKLKLEIKKLVLAKIKTIKENIIQKIFKDYNFEENDVDFISVLIKYMKRIYIEALASTLIQIEENNIISTKMTTPIEMDNIFFENIYKNVIDQFKPVLMKNSVFSRKDIDLYLGITYPCIVPHFKEIHSYIHNELMKDYTKNESDYYYCFNKNNYYDKEDDNYVKLKNLLERNIKEKFENYYFAKVFKNTKDESLECLDKNELIKLLFNDYMVYYLSESTTKYYDSRILKLFKVLYELFLTLNNIYDSDEIDEILKLENLSKFVLFIESYRDYIHKLCEFVYSTILYMNETFLDDYIDKIQEINFISDNKKKYKKYGSVYNLFYNLYETVIYCILNIKQDFCDISNDQFEQFLVNIRIFSDSLIKINIDLDLGLKQIPYLNDFIHVYEFLIKQGIPLKKNLKLYLEYLSEENEAYLLSESNEKEDDIIVKEFNYLKNLSRENNVSFLEYSKLVVKLLNNKIEIVSEEENYQLKLLKILCSNNFVISQSKMTFEQIFKNFHLIPINKYNNENKNEKEDDYDNDEEENEEKDKEENNYDEEEDEEEDEEDDEEDEEDEDDEEDVEDDEEDDEDNNGDNNEEDDEDDDEEQEDDDIEDKAGVKFLNKLEEEKNNSIIVYLNETNNPYLDEILLSLFDKKIIKYFESIKIEDHKIERQSLQIFKNSVQYVEEALAQNKKWNRLGVLYCISYIKLYCYHLSEAIYNNKFDYLKDINSHEIFKFLNGNNKFRKVIKIYILKILYKIGIGDYQTFYEFIKEKKLFIDDFDYTEKVPFALKELFLYNSSFDQYKELKEIHSIQKMENFKSPNSILDEIKKNDHQFSIFIFYDLIINEEISNLRKAKTITNKYYTNIYKYIATILNELDLPVLADRIISIYFSMNSMKKQIDFIQTLSPPEYEILLYAHKFAFLCSFAQPNTFYSNLLLEEVKEYLKETYIPGGEPKTTQKINSSKEIKKYVKSGSEKAIYMCSCGYCYTVGGCGGPMEKRKCIICKEYIGGENHRLVEREGHFRIYKNEEERRKAELNNFYYGPSKMFDSFMKEIDEEIKRYSLIKGYVKVSKEYFIVKEQKVRGIKHITYRILSFIFYSCILFSHELGNMTQDDINDFFYEDANEKDMSILSMLKDIWDQLKKELLKKQINNVQVFLNMVMPKLKDLITSNEYRMTKLNERTKFENECDKLISTAIRNYQDYLSIYHKNKQEILNIDDSTIKSILEETSNLNNLPKASYPLIHYFYVANYPNYQKFQEQLDNSKLNQYPVIKSYLRASTENIDKIEFLENFNNINPLVTYTLKKYHNKYSRAEAKEIKIADELNEDETMKKLFDQFKKGWEKIYKELSNFDCNGKLEERNITEKDCLAYILNDEKENHNYGNYIANAYKDFITFQNEFLKSIIEIKSPHDYLYSYIYQIKKEMVIQKASKNEIISLSFDNSIFESFYDLTCSFSYREYFIDNDNENGNEYEYENDIIYNNNNCSNINYLNYQENKFDLEAIERELAKILLPGKRLFKNEHEQDFITYSYEELANNNNIILDFKNKIMNEGVLSNEDKDNIKNLVRNLNYKIILMNLQSLFLYFTNKRNITGEEDLHDEINHLPENIVKLDHEFKRNIENLLPNLKLNQLRDFYDYVEEISFKAIEKEISGEASNDLDSQQINKLNEHFANEENLLISKKDLRNVVRKFMSRYLVSDIFNYYHWDLFRDYLNKDLRPELWDRKFLELEKEDEIHKFNDEYEKLQQMDIRIGQTLDFYKKLNNKKVCIKKTTETTNPEDNSIISNKKGKKSTKKIENKKSSKSKKNNTELESKNIKKKKKTNKNK